ncbi:hypothetical protein WG66_011898 [Moniliophthora roreri]|uniref:G-protein coupled receptors family 2 profile 2 domain-containing protein n=1 Tax=Moniliophthora roreri TaxID=221103 RepID=A0A0W0G7T8_MONRR|nr:hypothetical protein WG66_011898 [Moniliophthora roreri]
MFVGPRAGSVLLADRPADTSQYDTALVNLFVAFQLFGLFGSIITCASALYSSVQRHPTWYSFIASWIISCFSYSLLFFGGQLFAPKPSLGLCTAQASLVYGAPPITATATLGLVTQIWFSVHSALRGRTFTRQRLWGIVILFAPYILFVCIFTESLVIALVQPKSVRRTGSGMYCNTGVPIPGRLSAALVSVVLLIALGIEIRIIIALRRNYKDLKSNAQTMNLIIRVLAFTLFGVIAIVLGVYFTFTVHHGAELNVLVSTLPVAAVLVFGTQKDLLQAWMFWKWQLKARNRDSEVISKVQSTSTISDKQLMNVGRG